jgi:hypothetical protein
LVNKSSITQKEQLIELITKIRPDVKCDCIGFYSRESFHEVIEGDTLISNCSILELVTSSSADIKDFIKMIEKAGFRLLDILYYSNEFHYLIRKLDRQVT